MAKNDYNFEDSVEYDLYNSDFGNRILDEYTLLDKMHQGGGSQVFVIRNNVSNKLFILKTVNYNRSDFNLELLKDINHPGIVKVHNVFKTDKYWYIIKDFIEGENLEQKIDRDGAYDEKGIIDMAIKLCAILDYLHNMSPSPFIYRDLKPSNLMMKPNGEIILIDLDSIRQFKKESQKDTIYIGTEGFASPEQFGFGQTDSRSDIYTLGTTLYHLLTCQEPAAEKLKMKNIREFRKDISLHLAKVIEKCTMFNPDSRYQNISDLKNELMGISSKNILISFFYKTKLSITRKSIIIMTSILGTILFIALSISWYNIILSPNGDQYEKASADNIQTDKLSLEPKVIEIEYDEFVGASEPIIKLDTHDIDVNEIINIRLEYDGNLVPIQYDTTEGDLKLINTYYPANLLELNKEYTLSLTASDNSIYRMKFTPMPQELKDQGKHRIIYMPSNPDKGFNYPYYLMLPSEESIKRNEGKKNYLLVEPYNMGEVSDDMDKHIELALANVKINTGIAEELGLPRLLPVFIRPESPLNREYIYTHALSRYTILLDRIRKDKTTRDLGIFDDMKRIDLQLIEMTKDAMTLLYDYGWDMEKQMFIWGTGAAGDFANRFTFLHPELVKASFHESLPVLPMSTIKDTNIPYPFGTADYLDITGHEFDITAYNKVAKLGFIYAEYNDNPIYPDLMYSPEKTDEILKRLPIQDYPTKWEIIKELYVESGLNAGVNLYEDLGLVNQDTINFFEVNRNSDSAMYVNNSDLSKAKTTIFSDYQMEVVGELKNEIIVQKATINEVFWSGTMPKILSDYFIQQYTFGDTWVYEPRTFYVSIEEWDESRDHNQMGERVQIFGGDMILKADGYNDVKVEISEGSITNFRNGYVYFAYLDNESDMVSGVEYKLVDETGNWNIKDDVIVVRPTEENIIRNLEDVQ